MEIPLENAISSFNELAVSIYIYLLLSLTDFMGPCPIRD
jgi:hypothetical protein